MVPSQGHRTGFLVAGSRQVNRGRSLRGYSLSPCLPHTTALTPGPHYSSLDRAEPALINSLVWQGMGTALEYVSGQLRSGDTLHGSGRSQAPSSLPGSASPQGSAGSSALPPSTLQSPLPISTFHLQARFGQLRRGLGFRWRPIGPSDWCPVVSTRTSHMRLTPCKGVRAPRVSCSPPTSRKPSGRMIDFAGSQVLRVGVGSRGARGASLHLLVAVSQSRVPPGTL